MPTSEANVFGSESRRSAKNSSPPSSAVASRARTSASRTFRVCLFCTPGFRPPVFSRPFSKGLPGRTASCSLLLYVRATATRTQPQAGTLPRRSSPQSTRGVAHAPLGGSTPVSRGLENPLVTDLVTSQASRGIFLWVFRSGVVATGQRSPPPPRQRWQGLLDRLGCARAPSEHQPPRSRRAGCRNLRKCPSTPATIPTGQTLFCSRTVQAMGGWVVSGPIEHFHIPLEIDNGLAEILLSIPGSLAARDILERTAEVVGHGLAVVAPILDHVEGFDGPSNNVVGGSTDRIMFRH